ncbi:MAG: glutamine ABC transporter permease GlnP [Polymorphum sp.]|uniref:Amino acid ABC transporter membrane protein 1, PAAT family (TC 3.A.1.3.-) n=1 Tax=Pannonibacter indicus TaxID=466044 RepID=A0A0K6I3D0_9HYPH|nr:ABC transporter permease [Pannonibacter indicus]MBA4203422.1 glutamine ABC transporter permease GlnP [Polymorphum sp.]CUA97635.1 amino acid ABC transporter membrane protein 1, PAAT family (TC 3.A.1.3.-) [Pannonibacter indicus]
MDKYLELLAFGPTGWGDELLGGLFITVSLALSTLPFGLVLGFIIALGKKSPEPSLQLASTIYTTIFRGLPELLTLFLVYFGFQIALKTLSERMGYGISIEVNSFLAGMIALALVFSAYSSEVFHSAFLGIPQGQYEGGKALGLSRFQTFRLVVMPQLIRLAMPGLTNLWLILLKETSLVSAVGLVDVMRQTGIAARNTKEAFFFYSLACLIYLMLAILSSLVLRRTEGWAKRAEMAR